MYIIVTAARHWCLHLTSSHVTGHLFMISDDVYWDRQIGARCRTGVQTAMAIYPARTSSSPDIPSESLKPPGNGPMDHPIHEVTRSIADTTSLK